MRQILVMAKNASDLVGMMMRERRQALLELGVAGPEHGELRAARDDRRRRIGQEIESLLPGHPADHRKQQAVSVLTKSEPALQREFVWLARRQRCRSEPRGNPGVRFRS